MKTVRNQDNLINKIADNVNSRFPDGGIIGSFAILDPQNLPSPSDLPPYGNSEIDTLSMHFGEPKNTDDGIQLEPLLKGQEFKEEWIIFKQLLSKNSSIQGMAKKLLSSIEMQEQFPQMLKLLTIALTVPVSSIDCERGFSQQNLIKTKIRAKLKTENVFTLTKMSVDTTEMEKFDFHKAFVIWCLIKDRVICRPHNS